MKRFASATALVCMLLLGLAAQPARAQQGRWAAARQQHRAMMKAQRQAAAAHANANGKPPAGGGAHPNAAQAHPANSESANAKGAGSVQGSGQNSGQNGVHNEPQNGVRSDAQNSAQVNGQGNARGMAGLPPKWVENLRDKSPQEQERFMQNNERFQSLPPARQQQIRMNLQKYNKLSPTEQSAIKDRERAWQNISPEQRDHVKNDLLPKWQQLPVDRKQLINGRLHTLQGPGYLTALFGNCFVALYFSGDATLPACLGPIAAARRSGAARLRLVRVTARGAGTADDAATVVDEIGQAFERYDAREGTLYLIRPDGYVMGRWRDAASAAPEIDEALHLALEGIYVPLGQCHP